MIDERGFGLLELMIVTALTALLSVLAAGVMAPTAELKEAILQRGSVESEVVSAAQHVLNVGRAAGNSTGTVGCTNTTDTLTCDVDFSRSSIDTSTRVRFRFLSERQALVYERQLSEAPEVWETERMYHGISAFILCGDAQMGASCPLAPQLMNREHTANLGPQVALAPPLPPGTLSATPSSTGSNRFFRFRMEGLPERADLGKAPPFAVQYAFYVRNPLFLGDGSVVYQYGTK
ncbi:MAG: prepilin-type N-terminal cleavage/methylation domain-containing protein [Bdellovibrionaceae bacterium]|nr:prepilin-type N-terminal cleavage/methylation domain-containing protein [Bdellovibrionales bacterium]MCB9255042.1 prepilin-type N-terminal cleavage/methylation domain-containing protein [Pseudobdellovibrionaceae bacterium]